MRAAGAVSSLRVLLSPVLVRVTSVGISQADLGRLCGCNPFVINTSMGVDSKQLKAL
jgi:hypothetical protein